MNIAGPPRSIQVQLPKAYANKLHSQLPKCSKYGTTSIMVVTPSELSSIGHQRPYANTDEILDLIKPALLQMKFTPLQVRYAKVLDTEYRTFFLHLVSKDLVDIRESIRVLYNVSSGVFNPDPSGLGHFFVYLGHEGTHARIMAKPDHSFAKVNVELL